MDKFKCIKCNTVIPNECLEASHGAWCPHCEEWTTSVKLTPPEADKDSIDAPQRCPFCGCADADYYSEGMPDSDDTIYAVYCSRCDRSMSSLESMQDAMTCWNTFSTMAAKAKGFTVPTEPLHGGCMWDITKTED